MRLRNALLGFPLPETKIGQKRASTHPGPGAGEARMSGAPVAQRSARGRRAGVPAHQKNLDDATSGRYIPVPGYPGLTRRGARVGTVQHWGDPRGSASAPAHAQCRQVGINFRRAPLFSAGIVMIGRAKQHRIQTISIFAEMGRGHDQALAQAQRPLQRFPSLDAHPASTWARDNAGNRNRS